jgi:hypothetical protein
VTGTPAAGAAYVVLWNPQTGGGVFRLREMGIVSPSGTVANVQLQRIAAKGTPSVSPSVGNPSNNDNVSDPTSAAEIDTGWSVQPTIYSGSASPLRITSFPTGAPGVIWRWKRDELLVQGVAGIGLWNPSSGSIPGVLHVYLRWEE